MLFYIYPVRIPDCIAMQLHYAHPREKHIEAAKTRAKNPEASPLCVLRHQREYDDMLTIQEEEKCYIQLEGYLQFA